LAVCNARTVCYVEREAYRLEILASRMEEGFLDKAPCWSDVRTFDGRVWRGTVDCISGGYPCQPFSISGKKLGADDPRHLWPDIFRIIQEIQPTFCFFENVSNHIWIGFSEVCEGLEGLGYSIEAGFFTAEEVGAPHQRERLYFMAYSERRRVRAEVGNPRGKERGRSKNRSESVSKAQGRIEEIADDDSRPTSETKRELGDSQFPRLEGRNNGQCADEPIIGKGGKSLEDSSGFGHRGRSFRHSEKNSNGFRSALYPPRPNKYNQWQETQSDLQPAFLGMDDGLADWLDDARFANRNERIRAVGNGVVPQTATLAFVVLYQRLMR